MNPMMNNMMMQQQQQQRMMGNMMNQGGGYGMSGQRRYDYYSLYTGVKCPVFPRFVCGFSE